jgi:hypothetical protein
VSSSVELFRGERDLRLHFSNHTIRTEKATVTGFDDWCSEPIHSVFIPVKEMLSNAPGFRALYTTRKIHYEEVYADIIDRAFLPPLRGPTDAVRLQILGSLQKAIDGKVTSKNNRGNLEFSLVAEGFRKLGLLWVLLQNGTLLKGSVLCWDEPEANLNPKLMRNVVEVLLSLQRLGVQVLVATHDYVFLKEVDLQRHAKDKISFHSLFRTPDAADAVSLLSVEDYLKIHPNAIADTFADLLDRDAERALQGNAEPDHHRG